jgi:acyl phosphate:glycerol-3-phosphate acyltransferase
MSEPLTWLLAPVATYLLGAIPFAFVIGSIFGVDLRKVGTGNVGAGNLRRVVGLSAGVAAALLDGLKALIPVLVLREMGIGPAVVAISGLTAVVGHNWSIFLRGRSGRGLAPSAGVLAGVDPWLILWPGGWAIAGWKLGGGIAGFFGWASLPVIAALLKRPDHIVLACLGLGLLMIVRRMQGNPSPQPGVKAALYRAVFDRDPGQAVTTAEEPVGN